MGARLGRLLWSPYCQLCGDGIPSHQADLGLCDGCRADLPYNRHACRCCALPLPPAAPTLCGPCSRKPPPFDDALAPFHYRPPIDRLLLELKFNQRLHLGRSLGHLWLAWLAEQLDPAQRPDLILPIPLHPHRLRTRGYNQALELARPLARELAIPIATDLCRRSMDTPQQTRLDRKERRCNLRGAFEVTAPLTGRHLVVLDDVVTTGATVVEVAKILKRAGAERVSVWSLARAEDPKR